MKDTIYLIYNSRYQAALKAHCEAYAAMVANPGDADLQQAERETWQQIQDIRKEVLYG